MAELDRIILSGNALLEIVKDKLNDSPPLLLEQVTKVLFGFTFVGIVSPLLKNKVIKSIYSEFTIIPTDSFIQSMAKTLANQIPGVEAPDEELEEVDEDEEDDE